MARPKDSGYTPTEAKWKDTAEEMYITYDLPQTTRSGTDRLYPKVRRVYIAGDVEDWDVGDFEKRSGRLVHGVRIEYRQGRESYTRRGYRAERGGTVYEVPPAEVKPSGSRFTKIVEVPHAAQHVQFRGTKLPKKYQNALQAVR